MTTQGLGVPVPPPAARSEVARTMQGIGPVLPRGTAQPRPAAAAAPRSMPVAAPFESGSMVASFGPAQSLQVSMPAAPRLAAKEGAPSRGGEAWIGTLQLHRSRRGRSLARRLVVPMVVVAALGAAGGGYLALEWQRGRAQGLEAAPVAAAPAVSAPVSAPAPAVAPVAAAIAPALVDVLIVSSPAGATVTLVDRGKTSFLGTTPISTSIDPSRKYDLVFSHPGQPAWMEPLDPSTTRRVEVTLGRAAKEERKVAEAPRPRSEGRPARVSAAPAPAGDGILMISSKPPCEILIDGKPTGLTTPQREIPLPAGSHQVTLVNKAERIHETISVQITPDQPTKVIQDLMK